MSDDLFTEMVREMNLAAETERENSANGIATIGGRWWHADYAKSYLVAARSVFDNAIRSDSVREIVVPCVFLIRHGIELILKDLILALIHFDQQDAKLNKLIKLPQTHVPLEPSRAQSVAHHRLTELAKTLNECFERIGDQPIPENWTQTIDAIEQLENGAVERMRYPTVRKHGRPKVMCQSFPSAARVALGELLAAAERMLHEGVSLDDDADSIDASVDDDAASDACPFPDDDACSDESAHCRSRLGEIYDRMSANDEVLQLAVQEQIS